MADPAYSGLAAARPVEWRATWIDTGCPQRDESNCMRSVARATAAEVRAEALSIVESARRGEVRISLTSETGSVTEVFTSRYELQNWIPEREPLPLCIESLWQVEERRRCEAQRYYCRLRDILTEAAHAGVIRRDHGRELRSRARAVLLGD